MGLSTEELPSHTHYATTSTEGNHAHEVMEYAGKNTTITNNHLSTSTNSGYTGGITGYNGAHTHTIYVYDTGGNVAHENRPPYQGVNRWHRTA